MKKMKTKALAAVLAVLWTVSAVLPSYAETETIEEQMPEETASGSLTVCIETAGGRVVLEGGTDTVVLIREESGFVRAVHADGTEDVLEAGMPFILTDTAGTTVRAAAAADPGYAVNGFRLQTEEGTADAAAQPVSDVSAVVVIGETPAVLSVSFAEETVEDPEQPEAEQPDPETEEAGSPAAEPEKETGQMEEETGEADSEDDPAVAEQEGLPAEGAEPEEEQQTEETGILMPESISGGDPEKQEPEMPSSGKTVEDEEEEDKEEDEEEGEENDGKEAESIPVSSTRLLVRTADVSILDADAVIGVMDDVYLLQFPSEEEAGKALAEYEKAAEFAAEDLNVCIAGYGTFGTGDPEAEIVMTESDNPFAEADPVGPVVSARPVIALIDTGVSGTKEVSGRYSVLGDGGYDGNGHGSAMLETIRGFDPKAEVVSIKALDDSGIGTVSSLYAAVRMAIDMHVSVINLSLSAYSTEENEAVSSIIREAVSDGIIVVGAAGNRGSDAGNYIPANIPEAVITAACNKQGERLPSSNYGSTVDLYVLAGSSSYAAATLSGIISAVGGIPAPDGNAVFAPAGGTAASDYVDGLCYDGMSGNFSAAGVSYTVHNAGGTRLSDLIPGLTYESLNAWLGSHENDDYYLNTPYPERVVNGVPQYILGRNGDCDNRNPNGDCSDIHGNDDYAGVAMMNCTGFVWHALWKASGLSYSEGFSRIPAWGGVGAGSWKSFIQNNHLEYMTVKSGGTNEINDMLSTAMYSATGPDGRIFLEKGDIIWFWVDQIPLGTDDLPVNGYFGGLADKAHVGIYWPSPGGNDNRWWDSIGICEYEGENGYYLRNMLHHFTPKTGSVAMTIVKLGRSTPPAKVNIQKTSADAAMTDANPCYSFAGAEYAVYESREDASAMTDPVTVFVTDAGGYGESEEVLESGREYFIRETRAPENGSYQINPGIYPATAEEPDKVTKETAVRISEIPENDPAVIRIEKISSSGVPAAEGRSLAGTQFTIRYYKGEYTDLSGLPDPDRTWVLEVKEQEDGAYRAFLLPDYKVSGDDFYYLPGNPDPVLPLGTVTIEETKAAEGYLLENTYKNGSASVSGIFLAQIRKKGAAVQLTYGDTPVSENGFTAADTPVYGGVKICKMDAETKEARPQGDASLKDAVFEIVSGNEYSVTIGGKHYRKGEVVMTVRTDENGFARTGERDLQYGSYIIREKTDGQPSGYLYEGTLSRTFSVREDGKITDLTEAGSSILNRIIKGGVKIQKLDDDMRLDMGGKPYAEGDKSFLGAEFTIYNKSAHAVKNHEGRLVGTGGAVQVIRTDAGGAAQTGIHDLPYGTYEIRETKASEGFKVNTGWKKTFTVREDGIRTEFINEEDACYEPDIKGGVQVQKTDRELKKAEALGEGSLSGITFQIINASAHAVKNKDGKTVEVGGVMQEITTDPSGIAETGETDLPYGTYILHELTMDDLELSANDSYLNEGAEDIVFRIREDGVRAVLDENGNGIVAANQVKRNDISLRKAEDGTDRPMGGIPFVIESAATGERHVIVTDPNGIFSSRKYAHSRNTNANDRLLEGYTEETVISDEDMDYRSGCWFGLGQDGTMADVSDSLPAFPYGKYTLTELSCEANGGYERIRNYPFMIGEDVSETGGEILFLGSIHNIPVLPEIRTRALDDKTGDHVMSAEEKAGLTDTVSAENLQEGKTYVLSATLMDVETQSAVLVRNEDGNRIKVTGETVFTASSGSMEIPVPIGLDASALAGKTLVIFEQLFLMEEDGTRVPVAEHREITDEGQTIIVPEIRTSFLDTESDSHTGRVSREQKVEDTVWYTGLIPGKEAAVTATVMTVGENGEPAELKDRDGKVFTKTVTFTPVKSEGSVRVEFTIDSGLLEGSRAVCFETVSYEGIPIAVHADIEDRDQTVWYPKIRTMAADKMTGGHVASVSENGVFTDTVSYSGLEPGRAYTAKAALMDAETGEPVRDGGGPVTAEKTFTPTAGYGEVSVEIPVNTKALAGRKTVVFEELFFREKAGEEDTPVAEHKDRNDKDQQIRIPEIRTPDSADGDKEYTDGPDMEQSVKITFPEAPAVPLMAGTVRADSPTAGVSAPGTGDTGRIWLYVLLAAGGAAACAALYIVKKKGV